MRLLFCFISSSALTQKLVIRGAHTSFLFSLFVLVLCLSCILFIFHVMYVCHCTMSHGRDRQ